MEPTNPSDTPPTNNDIHISPPPIPDPPAPVTNPNIYPTPIVASPLTPSSNSPSNDDYLKNDPPAGITPQPVVKVLSPRGVEYVFLTVTLFTAAAGLISALIALVNGKTDFGVLEFPTAILVVSVPIFAWLFLRLKKAEVNNPSLRQEPSKRRSTQYIQIVSFVICLFTLIGMLTAIFSKMSGSFGSESLMKLILDAVVILAVLGGILLYYWRDEHRPV